MQRIESLIAYLDSVSALYPCGIVAQAIDETAARPGQCGDVVVNWGKEESDVALVAVCGKWSNDARGRPFAGVHGELLSAIIEKGLARSLEDVRVTGVQTGGDPSGGEAQGRLRRSFKVGRGQILLVLGVCAARELGLDALDFSERRGKPFPFGQGQAVLLYGLEEISENKKLKKEFWLDLQEVMRSCVRG